MAPEGRIEYIIPHNGLPTEASNKGQDEALMNGIYAVHPEKALWDRGVQGAQQHRLNYADDYHASWICYDEQSLHKAVKKAPEFLALLAPQRLRVPP